jgi:hypothetical protein
MRISICNLVARNSTRLSPVYLHIPALTIECKAIQRGGPTMEKASSSMRYDNDVTKLMLCAEIGRTGGLASGGSRDYITQNFFQAVLQKSPHLLSVLSTRCFIS